MSCLLGLVLLNLAVIHCVWHHIRSLVGLLVATVVIPASMPSIVVVPQDHTVDSCLVGLRLRDVCDPVILLGDRFLHPEVLLGLNILLLEIKVQFVVVTILGHLFGPFHVEADW